MLENIRTEFEGCFSEISIDNAGDFIRNVALVGQISKNGRTYTREALSTAAGLYNNVRVYIDHPDRDSERRGWRSVRDLAGKISNARFDGSKIRGDIELLGGDGGKLISQIASSMPEIAGMSHNVYGKYHREDGVEVVESIDKVVSIDVVTEPATNAGFFESILQKGEEMSLKEIAKELKTSGDFITSENVIEIEPECTNPESENSSKSASMAEAEQIARMLKG